MINFLKEHSYDVFKMFVNQLGMTMFGLVLSFATYMNNVLFLLSGILSIVFYLVLLYTMTWEIGFSEKIRIDAGRLRFRPLKGFFISLCANSVNLLLAILSIVGFYAAIRENGLPVSPEWAVNLYAVPKTIAVFLQGMYYAVVGLYFPNTPWILLLITVPALVTCTVAYIAGVKGFRILPYNRKPNTD